MQNTLKLAAIFFALAQLSFQCGNGCLKCTVPEVCDLCDSSNAFVLDEGQCVHQPFQDCLTYNLEGKCLLCKEGLYLNLDQKKCLPIQKYKEVEHCLFYSPQGNCSLCDSQFFLSGTICAPLETEIENCQVYNTKNTCQECAENFLLSVDKRTCVPVAQDSKCLGYSLNKCNQCNEQSVEDKSYYQKLIQQKAAELNTVNQQYIFTYFTTERHYYFETCILKKVSNCVEFQDFQTCIKCQKGFYLQDNKCKQNPQNFIPRCDRYENINKCIRCQQGYFLESEVSCKAIEPVENCILYDGTSNKTQCKECEESFYLQIDNTCASRTLEVESCAVYAINNNICAKCIDGMILTSDFKKCLLQIENCSTYQSSSVDTVNLQCSSCINGYYLAGNICEVGSVVNCKVYNVDQNVCAQCKNKYYLSSGECKLHGDINNCEVYSQNEAGKCTQCRSGTIKFPKTTSCQAVVPIEGCKTYSEVDKCSKCQDGYNFVSATQCDPISFGLNCTYQVNGECQVCDEGFFLNANKECVEPVAYGLEFCDESEINVNGLSQCKVCKQGAFSYVQNNNYVCRTEESLKRGWNVQELKANCQSFKKEGNVVVCTQCNNGFYLMQSDNSCQDTCSGTIYRIKLEDNKTLTRNLCMPTEDQCRVKTLKQITDAQPHDCVQCADNNYAKVDFANSLQLLGQRVDNLMTSQEDNLYYKPIITCQAVTPQLVVRSNNNQLVDNCEYYYDLHNNEIGCAKCNQGFSGLVKNWEVVNCIEYDAALKKCVKCLNTFQLSANGLECTPLNVITNCQRYKENTQDVCELCKSGFFLSAPTTCSPVTVIPNCAMYSMDQNKCVQCKSGYRFNNAKDVCYAEISKCETYSNPQTSNDIAICTTCQDGFYPINQNLKCEKGNIENCWRYKQNRVNECEYYNNNIPFQDQNKCSAVQPIEGCSKYSDVDTCVECNAQSHYLSGETCCPYRHFNTGSQCEQIRIANCKSSSSLTSCDQCLEGFYPDMYQNEVSPPHVCCGLGSYWHPTDLECSSKLDVTLNQIGCSLFSQTLLKCVHCKQGFYLSTNRYCCPLGQYHAIENNVNVCKDIPDTATNCVKYDGINNECLACKDFEQGDEFEYFLGATSKKCCKQNHESDTNTGCVANLTGCKVVNANGTDCDTCRDDFQLEGTKCCAKKVGTQVPQYYDTPNTNCVNVTTNTIDNCVYYKLDANSNVVCKQCADQFVLSNSNQTCCALNKVYVGSTCVDTEFVYKNCATVNITTNLCSSCQTNFYTHNGICVDNGKVFDLQNQQIVNGPTNNCKTYQNTANQQDVCATCEDDYQLDANNNCITKMKVTVNNVVYTYENLTRGCAYFNLVTSTCVKCKGGYYKKAGDLMCCQYGEKLNSNQCIALADNTCQTVDANDACTQRSSNTLQNCKTSVDNQVCTECNFGHFLVQGVCKSESEINQTCSNFSVTSNCKQVDLTNCTCTSCHSWAYGEHCCDHGTKWDTNTSRCVDITEDVHCAQWNSADNNCDVCFFDTELKTIAANYKWEYLSTSDSDVASSGSNSYPVDYNIWLNASTKKCCPLKQGIKDGRCQFTTITNCRKPVYANNAWTCQECDYGYDLANNDTQCNAGTCNNGNYTSNGTCCPEGQYFSKEDSRCHMIIDSNCARSTEANSCTEACSANYSKRSFMQATLAQIHLPQRPQGPAFFKQQQVYLCEAGADISAQFNIDYVAKIVDNCQVVDATNAKCSTCKDGFYLETGAAMCCANDKALVTLTEGNVVQNGYCYTIANLLDNCTDYDIATKKCKNCESGYELTHGRCCNNNKHFNVKTATCEHDHSNCAIYDSYKGICRLCNNGYHISNKTCVQTDKFYNSQTSAAVAVQDVFINCSKVTDSPDKECLQVQDNSNSYLHRGRSCPLGQYNDGTQCQNISALGTEFLNCLELNHQNKCQNCSSNYYYTNGRCCKDQEYFEPYIKKCMPINKYRNCKQASKDKNNSCQVCDDGYYVGAYGFCVEEGKKVVDQYGNIDTITIENCTRVSDNNQCIQCTGTKVIYDNNCLDYDNISSLQRIGGCRIIKAGTPPTCLECQDNYYLTKEDEKCCQFGTYFNGTDCISLSLIALNCKTYEYGTCNQCQDGFYLSNNSACCQEGQYAKSASECAQIDLLNCSRSSNNGVCEKCNTGFMLVNGVCRTIENLPDCSIGADANNCLICNTGFYLNAAGQCVAQDAIQGCVQKTVNENTCSVCDTGLYYDGHQCCANSQYTRITGVIQGANGYSCENLQPTTQQTCQRIDNNTCTSCGTDQYLFNDQCCPYGQYHDGQACVASTAAGLENCRIFKDANTCQEYTNEQGEDLSCLNSKYFHLGHCCSVDHHWDSTNNTCTANSTVTQYQNCQKLNDQMQCTKCSSGYLSNGLCCAEGQYNVLGTCTNISVTDCLQYDGTFCLKCGNSKNLSSFNRCCDQNYYFSDGTCNVLLTDQGSFDIFSESLTSCGNSKYPANDKLCCAVSEYDNANTCTALTNAATCEQVYKGGADNTCAVCSTVDANSVRYQAFDNTCVAVATFPRFYPNNGDPKTFNATRESVITDCQQMGSDGLCSKCQSGKNLSQGICLTEQFLDISDMANIALVALLTNCQQGSSATNCTVCNSGYFTTANNNACCADGVITADADTCSTTVSDVPNCIEFAGHGDSFKAQCQTCMNTYNKYDSLGDQSILTCCAAGKRPGADNKACEPFGYNVEKCAEFDHLTKECLQCKPTFNGENYYLSVGSVCCKEGEMYDTATKLCAAIDNSSFPNCLQVHTVNSVNTCAKCTANNYFTGSGSQICCALGQYNNSSSCATISGVSNCSKADADDDCKVCAQDYQKLIVANKGVCCQEGQYFNGTNCVNITTSLNCLKVPDNQTTEAQCEVCKTGYLLTEDDKACCEPDSITGQGCKKNQLLYQTDVLKYCGEWDRKSLSCKSCQESGYYASNGGCCQEGTYSQVNANSFSCTNITVNNCEKFDDANGCSLCSAGYILDKSNASDINNACVQQTIANGYVGCLQVDNNLTKCELCQEGYYLHKNKCAPVGQKRNAANNTSENMTIQNCLRMKSDSDTECEVCKNEYYLTQTKTTCCQEGTYLHNGQCVTQGGATDPKPVENCAIFEDNPEICTKCKFGYVKGVKLAGTHICLKFRESQSEELCEEAYITIANSKNTFNCTKCKNHQIDYVLKNFKTDRNISYNAIQGCNYYDTQIQLSQSSLNCMVCEDNTSNFLSNGICQPRQVTNLEHCKGQMPYAQDTCTDCNTGYYLDINNICQAIPVENCQQYDGTNCVVCNESYTLMKQNGVYVCVHNDTFVENVAQSPTFFKGYINQCSQQDTCVNYYVGGISSTLSRLFSCHVCTFKDMIPFVSVNTTLAQNNNAVIESIQRYKKSQNGQAQNLGEQLNSSQCLKPVGDTFDIANNQFNFPSNCSLGMINSSLPPTAFESNSAQANQQNLGIYCVACKAGYKAFYGVVTHQVYKCESINYCQEKGDNFNECKKCSQGYVFKFDPATKLISKDSCEVFTQDQNCLAADFSDVNNIACKFCKKGHSLNKAGLCEQTRASDCVDAKFERLDNNILIQANNEELIMRFQNGEGCQQCKDNHVKALETSADYFCEQSPVVQQKLVFANTQVYQQTCLQYENNSDHKCVRCQEGSVLNIYGTCLEQNTLLQNCRLAENQDLCKDCHEDFVKLNNLCVVKDIDNCLQYIENPQDGKKRCARCKSGYGLENGLCAKDLFNPCVQVDEENICESCLLGFHLVTLKNNNKLCIEVITHQNCSAYISSNFQNFDMRCEQCESDQFVLLNTDMTEVCNPLPEIKNCQTYDISNNFDNSTLNCLQCNKGYYLSNNECLPRLNLVQNCLNYHSDSQLCQQCDVDYYLSADKKTCVENPRGIQHCKEYKSSTECSVCQTQYYVLEGECKAVKTENIVQMCEVYDPNQTCVQCVSNYILGGNVCESIVASNCLEIENRTTCKSCATGFKLETVETITSCVEIQKESIQNCQLVSDTTPFVCVKCDDGYYILDGQCEVVEQKIPMCKEYESPSICSRCDNYSILSSDRTTCASLINQNCLSAEEQKEGFCVVCKPGYVLVDGQCQFMTGEFDRVAENCMVYQDQAENGKLACMICQQKYSMNEVGVCTRTQIDGQEPDVVEDPTQNDNTSHLMIFSTIHYILWFYYAFF